MRRNILSAAAIAAVSAFAASCAGWGEGSRAGAMAGTWEGTGLQTPSDGTEAWPLRVVLNKDGDGAIAYPSLECGGALTRLRSIGNTVVYREVITYGADTCIAGGAITIVNGGQGKLFWYWTGEGTAEPEVSATAVLKRVAD